jgi:hypothetical protein
MKIVVESGKQGSGKTTLAKKLAAYFGESHKRMRFAEPLYEMHDACREILKKYKIQNYDYSKKDGDLLQLLGTEWGRKKIHDNVWVDCLLNALRELPHDSIVTIEDCRFENEFDAFNNVPNTIRIRLEASRATRLARAEMWRSNENHDSETGLDHYAATDKFDFRFDCDRQTADEIFAIVTAHVDHMS